MLFSYFGLAVCSARLQRFQTSLSESCSCAQPWPLVSPCDLACREISLSIDAPILHGNAAKLELWSLFQAQTRPKCTVKPRGPEDIANILAIARDHACHFAVLGGGMSPFKGASHAEDGITIDMSLLKNMKLDKDSMQLTVGGGSVWADVYQFLDPRNLSAAGTRNSLIGVAGSVLGGGMSFFSHNHGWSCDNVSRFEVVLANGSIVLASQTNNSDLFWALRGGGNNFGIVSSLTLDIFHQSKSCYTVQQWSMGMLESVLDRLETLTQQIPHEIEMIATTLAWQVPTNQFVITERLVASQMPVLPVTLPTPSSMLANEVVVSRVLEEWVYLKTTLSMAQKMDRMNAAGFYNYFGSVTVKNNVSVFIAIADIFQDEVVQIKEALGLRVNIVYNPLTVSTIRQMSRRGGNALGFRPGDGPLTIVNINLHWSDTNDTERMTFFMRRLIYRVKDVAGSMGMLHPYIFQNHAFEEDDVFAGYGEENCVRLTRVRDAVDPDGVFMKLQPGYHKL